MIEASTALIEGKTYVEVDTIEIKDKTYAYLVNEEDEFDYTIKRVTIEGDKIYYDPLKDKNEFELALMYFVKKHEKDIK